MESVRDGNYLRLNAQFSEHFNGRVYRVGFSRYNGLNGAIFIGAYNIALNLFKLFFNFFKMPSDRRHLARIFHFYFGHFFGSACNGFQAVFKCENSRRRGGGIFAKAMAGGHIGINAIRLQKTHHRHIGGKNRRLSHLSLFNGGFSFFQIFFAFTLFRPKDIGKFYVYHFFENDIGFIKGVLNHFIFGGQISHHIHILRALSREKKTYLGFKFRFFKGIHAFKFEGQRRICKNIVFKTFGEKVYFRLKILR